MDYKFFFLAIILLLFVPHPSSGMMSSGNYTIYADTVSTGGSLGEGGSYNLQDTIGDSPSGVVTSSSYEIRGGYQGNDRGTLTIDISSSSINLGDVSVSAISSGLATVSITTDAQDGYSLSIGSVSGSSMSAVSDGAVSAGQQEYGLAVGGADAQFADDRAVIAGLNLAVSSTAVTASATTLTFKASRSSTSTAATYSQTVTLVVSGNI